MDFDVNNSRFNDLIDNTRRSVAVREDTESGEDHGAMATAISPTNAFVFAWRHPLPDPEFRCFRAGNPVTTPYVSSGTDDVYGILYFNLGSSPGSSPVPMAKGASKVFTMQYQLY
jgi:hypothetical protein